MIGIVCAFFHTEGKGFYSSPKRPQSVARLGSQESAAVFCVGEIVVESGGGWLVWENTLFELHTRIHTLRE